MTQSHRKPVQQLSRHATCALLLLATWTGTGRAQPIEEPTAFAQRLVAAINSADPERRKRLAHPASLPCLNGADRTHFEEIFARQANPAIPPKHRVHVQPIAPTQPLLFEGKLDYPLRPTHQLQIDFETGPNRSRTLVLQVTDDGRQWREVWPCPKPEHRAQMLQAREARARHDAKVRALAAAVAEPLRSRLVGLVREGRKIEAAQQYRSATGEELAVARDVVEALMRAQK